MGTEDGLILYPDKDSIYSITEQKMSILRENIYFLMTKNLESASWWEERDHIHTQKVIYPEDQTPIF